MDKTCKQCGAQFQIPEEDIAFYKSISMPEPSLCIGCRHQKRLAFRNEMYLYHRKCDFSGKNIVSMYSQDKPLTIYDQNIWWSDKWDPFKYGRDFDFNRPFFEQYKELQKEVPRMSLNNINAENSEYCNLALDNKSCYLIFTADDNQDCAYCRFSDRNFKCFDCDYTYDSSECYECFDVEKGNRCLYSTKCVNSSGLIFCYNMIGCHDCIGCANLRNKTHFIFNKEYSKEDFEKKKKEFAINTYSGFKALKGEYEKFLVTQPRKYLETVNCENSLGDYLRDCKNATLCYNSVGLEDCKYMINCYFAKNCYDWDFVGAKGSIGCHEMSSCAYNMVNCHFCSGCWEGNNELLYCELCLHSGPLFGCIALRHKKYCILNKEYSKEEYEKLLPKIIEHMKKTSEWGEFFPIELSAYAYNETVASEYFPLTKEEVLEKGWRWKDDTEETSVKPVKYDIPDNIDDAKDEICDRVLSCEKTGNPHKIIPVELQFCKRIGIPLPRISWRERQKARMALRNPWMLWERECSKCGAQIMTTYAPERKEPIYCEKCYLDNVN